MNVPSVEEILNQLRGFSDSELTNYSSIVRMSCRSTDPVFFKPRYADFFWKCASTVPGWIADVVLANSEAESQGSAKLLSLWQLTQINKGIEDQILFHAKDEARHSRLFIKLVQLAFPNLKSSAEVNDIKAGLIKIKSSDLKKKADLVTDDLLFDNLIQMNMGEIRTLIHMHFLGPVIYNMSPKENKDQVASILQGLANDEVVHIGYTAKLIEEWCTDNNYDIAEQLYSQRMEDFHAITIAQTEATLEKFGANEYPDLLEI
jgi:hypothetical protein